MRIAVIDDEKYSRQELCYLIRQELPEAELREASSGVTAVELLEKERFDLLFIDIRLGDMMGTTLASLARKLMPQAKVVFATAFGEYAVKAFELGVDDYILKPFAEDRVREVLRRCLSAAEPQQNREQESHRIAVTSSRHTMLLDVGEIVYIESSGTGHSCLIHTEGGKSYTVTTALGEYERRLSSMGFFRIHKTCLVQLACVQDIFPWASNGYGLHVRGYAAVLPIGRERVKELRRRLEV